MCVCRHVKSSFVLWLKLDLAFNNVKPKNWYFFPWLKNIYLYRQILILLMVYVINIAKYLGWPVYELLSCLNVNMRRTNFTTIYFAISSSFPDMQTAALPLHPILTFISTLTITTVTPSVKLVPSRPYHTDSGLLRPALTYRREENKTKYFWLWLVWLQMQCSDNAP